MRKSAYSVLLCLVAFALVVGSLALLVPDASGSDAYTNGVAGYIMDAAAYAQVGKWDKMIAECNEAIYLNPNAIDAYRGRGAAYFEKGDWINVISNYSEVIRLEPNDPDSSNAYLFIGNAYTKLRQYDQAISEYDEAIKLDPKNSDAYFSRGYAYGYKRDFDKVTSDYTEVIRLDPTNAQAFYYRGYAYCIKRNYEAAASDYIRASQLDPNFKTYRDSLNSLAWLLATSPDSSIRNGKKSLRIAKRICELAAWGDWRYLDTLAAAYAETGDFDNAIKYQTKALNIQGSTEIREQFGLTQRLELYEQKKPYHQPPNQ
ncbi:MAG TPA: tetratricopeptide repeat protein [Candidatus Acidoferrum sp.]|jgi:tetratricopeptide (TPR) repeat protein|nr:tetratricopeptide repeat protein [Candidatus Acidoferrum sp.]